MALVIGAALVFAGCTSNGGPKDYTADVEENFTVACEAGNETDKQVTDVAQFCECVYADLQDEFTFDEFKALDNAISDAVGSEDSPARTAEDIAKLNADYVRLVEGCRKSGPSVPASAN